MPSAGKRTFSGWVTVIWCPSTSGIVGLSLNSLLRWRGSVRVGARNPGTLEDGGDEIGFGKGANKRCLAIDHRMGNAADAKLVR
jgi:hypothetical protein